MYRRKYQRLPGVVRVDARPGGRVILPGNPASWRFQIKLSTQFLRGGQSDFRLASGTPSQGNAEILTTSDEAET